ncbi:hypothetical protein SS1G_00038 [Sclerotinia sclerotiorum 1980 UF-70]|uniref:MARVEL domain-containing protein n=2 Tax=Sclerotinia sclerotiorum (strain ATCC 18683 / 1980 / Ss-1) TaxID=665079 RepID=A7E416_SCLS1|nr:hypothetical protein SS1G_00038 [Sclerotinia sclerotiorum 1980 UF-70]APA08245.1 hypothetical protein sscle_03g030150 [Sclerotinia sclerotiorum 1980 UF-70]EDN90638.1 hypothetical protein SS1G_00038 [Sclerotinia sclerotiorum 1980 UF-70]
MRGGGVALKALQWFLRGVEFCCAAIILGIFAYFLAKLSTNNLPISDHIKAVEGISGAGFVYTAVGLALLCCLAGFVFFSIIAIVLDFCFTGAFSYIAWVTRGGRSCTGSVATPLGNGIVDTNDRTSGVGAGRNTSLPSLRDSCRLNTACFAVAIVAAVFFFISLFVEIALIKHHKKEKAFGPSPNNGYTAGRSRRKFWQRQPARDGEYMAGGIASEKPDSLPAHTSPDDVRNSYATDTTMMGRSHEGYGSHTGYGHSPVSPVTATHGQQINGVDYRTSSPYTVPNAAEMPADGYRGAHQYRTGNGNF